MKRRLRIGCGTILGLFVLLIVLGAVFGSTSNKTSSTTGNVATTPAKTQHRSHTRRHHGKATHHRNAKPTPSYTGFGATRTAWNAGHTEDQRYAHDEVYNPDPGVLTGAEYNAIDWSNSHVTGYEMHFQNEPISEAKSQVLSGLPRDARTVWFITKGSNCAQQLVESKSLGRLLGDKSIGDPQGAVMIEYSSGTAENSYDASSVNDALLEISEVETPGESSDC